MTVLWQTKITVSFVLKDKYIVNEQHPIQKVMTPPRKVRTWCISMYHVIGLIQTRGIHRMHRVTSKALLRKRQKIRGCRGLLGRVVTKKKKSRSQPNILPSECTQLETARNLFHVSSPKRDPNHDLTSYLNNCNSQQMQHLHMRKVAFTLDFANNHISLDFFLKGKSSLIEKV